VTETFQKHGRFLKGFDLSYGRSNELKTREAGLHQLIMSYCTGCKKSTVIPSPFEINLDTGIGCTCSFATRLAHPLMTQGFSTTARHTSQHGGEDHEPC